MYRSPHTTKRQRVGLVGYDKRNGENMIVGTQEAPCPDHWPVWIRIPKLGTVGRGNCVRRPKKVDVRDGAHAAYEFDEMAIPDAADWKTWNEMAEKWLLEKFR